MWYFWVSQSFYTFHLLGILYTCNKIAQTKWGLLGIPHMSTRRLCIKRNYPSLFPLRKFGWVLITVTFSLWYPCNWSRNSSLLSHSFPFFLQQQHQLYKVFLLFETTVAAKDMHPFHLLILPQLPPVYKRPFLATKNHFNSGKMELFWLGMI